MYEAFEYLIDLYLSEFIVAILIISIIVVLMSIFHIVMSPNDSQPVISKIIKPKKKVTFGLEKNNEYKNIQYID